MKLLAQSLQLKRAINLNKYIMKDINKQFYLFNFVILKSIASKP